MGASLGLCSSDLFKSVLAKTLFSVYYKLSITWYKGSSATRIIRIINLNWIGWKCCFFSWLIQPLFPGALTVVNFRLHFFKWNKLPKSLSFQTGMAQVEHRVGDILNGLQLYKRYKPYTVYKGGGHNNVKAWSCLKSYGWLTKDISNQMSPYFFHYVCQKYVSNLLSKHYGMPCQASTS